MAGGKGTRIATINSEVPKPMIELLGKPILLYEIEALVQQGINDFILVIGHLGDVIKNYFGDGSEFGVNISYIVEDTPLGTAGALYFLKGKMDEDFLLLNGDTLFDINVTKFLEEHKKNKAEVTIITHPNSHPYDSGIIEANEYHQVTKWLSKEEPRLYYKNRVNAGIHMLSPLVLDRITELHKMDLDRDLLKPLIKEGKLYIYDSPEYIKDMGTPDRYYQVIEDIKNNKPFKRNLKNKQKAIFLDRDGTINKSVGFLTNIDELELLDGAAEAIKLINNSDYLAILVTNQPVIARGEVTLDELQEIHNKLETLLGEKGAFLDGIYFCPHHPDKGFEGERIEYKIECSCRKPKPGMLLNAAKDFNIDLAKSWMIGDYKNDVLAGINAGTKTVLVNNKNDYENIVPTLKVETGLLDAIKLILEENDNDW